MEALRVKLTSWTASFRYPTIQAGYQPTLLVPPPSTIQGLLSAAKGDIVYFRDLEFFGYVFISKGVGVDLEKIYALGEPKTDIFSREFLIDNELFLYLPLDWECYFRRPRYQLLLGRSCDIATVEEIKRIVLEKRKEVPIGGTVVPTGFKIAGEVQALPFEFDYSVIPRRVKKVVQAVVLPYQINLSGKRQQIFSEEIFYDPELKLGVWLWKVDEHENLLGKI